ncbi:MAG: cobalamin-dependent protein [Spirochaetaceae bacterium]|jgi:hypothetical protein|nr:cobalamin-dependent protein [Spirochaetaceae bacterium]
MKILLCTINAKWIHPSLALRLLKANLGEYEGDCAILELNLRQSREERLAALLAARPRILGLSVSIWNHEATLGLLRDLEAAWREGAFPVVVLGGPEVSFLPEGAELFSHAAYVIRREGEDAFRELCGSLLAGTEAARRDGPPRFIDAAPPELAKLRSPYPYYSDEDLRRKLVYVEASRGCPYGCEFCLSPPVSAGGRVRNFPLEPFLAGMEALIRRGARSFKFLDRSFNADIPRARSILEFFLERMAGARPGGGAEAGERPLCVHVEMTPSRFPAGLVEVLARFPPGGLRLEIGIQTLNPETAALVSRPLDGEAELAALRMLREETAAIIHADLIAGLPGEGLDSFASGFDRLWGALSGGGGESPRPEIQLGILKLLPGAAIVRRSETYGMRYAAAPPYEVLETAALPRRDLERVKNYARFWELIVNRGAFADLEGELCPPGEPVFRSFMELSGRLLSRFGRNWGIDRRDLREALTEELRRKG